MPKLDKIIRFEIRKTAFCRRYAWSLPRGTPLVRIYQILISCRWNECSDTRMQSNIFSQSLFGLHDSSKGSNSSYDFRLWISCRYLVFLETIIILNNMTSVYLVHSYVIGCCIYRRSCYLYKKMCEKIQKLA